MLVSRRHIVFGSLALPALAAKKPAVERPNVVLILVDNLPGWMLACYGNKEVRSPNIQRLSDTGTRFLNHYAAAPVPEFNRATLLTGRTPMQIGNAGTPGPADITFDRLLSTAGYVTHDTADPSDALSFLDQQAAAKSFALTLSFGALKPPYDSVPQKYLDMYARRTVRELCRRPGGAECPRRQRDAARPHRQSAQSGGRHHRYR